MDRHFKMKLLRETIRRLIQEALKFDELSNYILIKSEDRDLTYYLLLNPAITEVISSLFADLYEEKRDNDEVDEWNEIIWDDHEVLDEVIDQIGWGFDNMAVAMAGITSYGGPMNSAELKLFAAQMGWGPTLHDVVMGEVDGIIADREEVSPAAFKVYSYYHNNRSDIRKEPLDSVGHKWTPDTEDDAEWGSSGDYGNLRDKALDDPSITQDQFNRDPLNWIYYGEPIPQAKQAYDNAEELLTAFEPWVDDPEDILQTFSTKLAKVFFSMQFKRP